jgi:hypothetical protein
MWARTVEVMLGCWLALSPFIFRHPPEFLALWWNDLLCAPLIAALALLSLHRPFRHAHFLLIGISLWLIGFAVFQSGDPAAAAAIQNYILFALVLTLFAILPNEPNRPPAGWWEFESAASESGHEHRPSHSA